MMIKIRQEILNLAMSLLFLLVVLISVIAR